MLPCVRKLKIHSEGEGCVSGQLGGLVLVYVDPKFNLESNGGGLKERRGFLITNLLTQNVSDIVHSGSSAVQRECLTKSTQNLTKSRMLTG